MSALVASAIEKTPGFCGGKARVAGTRIPVWLLVLKRLTCQSDESVLADYPTLTQESLDAAWEYYHRHPVEVEQSIWFNDVAGNVPEGVLPPAAVVVAGAMLGLTDAEIGEAFDPPVGPGEIAAAWAEYRANPTRVRLGLRGRTG